MRGNFIFFLEFSKLEVKSSLQLSFSFFSSRCYKKARLLSKKLRYLYIVAPAFHPIFLVSIKRILFKPNCLNKLISVGPSPRHPYRDDQRWFRHQEPFGQRRRAGARPARPQRREDARAAVRDRPLQVRLPAVQQAVQPPEAAQPTHEVSLRHQEIPMHFLWKRVQRHFRPQEAHQDSHR